MLPSAPREEGGLYWGYSTRLAKGLSGLIRECPFDGGYDLKLGTSEHGQVRFARRMALFVGFGGTPARIVRGWQPAVVPAVSSACRNAACTQCSQSYLFGVQWLCVTTACIQVMQAVCTELAIDLLLLTSHHSQVVLPGNLELPHFRHILIAFGGPEGLEDCLAHDKRLQKTEMTDVFDLYLNTCPNQGSRTIRTEEAVLISMAFLQTAVARFGER